MKRISSFLVILLLLVICTSASATEKRVNLSTGISSDLATNLSDYDTEYIVDANSTNQEYWVKFTTDNDDAWTHIRIMNYSMVTGASYGIAFNGEGLQYKIYSPLGEVLAHRRVFNGTGEKVESYVTLKLEKNTEYKIQFWSKKTSSGIFSVELLKMEDKFGETSDLANLIPAGTPIQKYNMSGWGDIDWIKLESTDHDRVATFALNNFEFDTNYFKMSLYDSFGIKVASKVCKMGKTEYLTYTLKAGESYYLEIKVDDEQSWYGRYEFGWCTESAHIAAQNIITLREASCSNTGLQCDSCQICEAHINTIELPKLEHVAGEVIINKPATCIDLGHKEIRCVNCDEVLSSETLPMVGHTIGAMQPVKSPTCTEPGLSEQHCTVCNITLSTETPAALGHTPGEVIITEPTCTEPGSKVIKCSVCGEILTQEEIPATGHTPGTMQTVKSQTCTEPGLNEYYCVDCNYILSTEESAALGHTPGEWRDVLSATCTADGSRNQYCADCNAILATEAIPAHGHRPMDWQTTREAACRQSGLREKKCSDCGMTLESEQLNAWGHSYTEWEILTEATKEQEGEKRRHCINCGDTQFEKIEKLPKVLGIF